DGRMIGNLRAELDVSILEPARARVLAQLRQLLALAGHGGFDLRAAALVELLELGAGGAGAGRQIAELPFLIGEQGLELRTAADRLEVELALENVKIELAELLALGPGFDQPGVAHSLRGFHEQPGVTGDGDVDFRFRAELAGRQQLTRARLRA